MTTYLLNDQPVFPDPSEADETGLIAVGGDLSVERLVAAYSNGIFPWFIEEGLIFWFSPDPRMVLFPEKLKINDSLQRRLKRRDFEVTFDKAFNEVITRCSKVPRSSEKGTWISKEFIEAYNALHQAGFAHSVEVWQDGELAGGLYGVSNGAAFFGESMFHLKPDASKIALVHLVEKVKKLDFLFIDCQVETRHFYNMGAEMISRRKYLDLLKIALNRKVSGL
jgi:leucyl/phenylalanyl-tRNA---protein transferase